MKALIRKTIILILVFMTLFTSIMPTNVFATSTDSKITSLQELYNASGIDLSVTGIKEDRFTLSMSYDEIAKKLENTIEAKGLSRKNLLGLESAHIEGNNIVFKIVAKSMYSGEVYELSPNIHCYDSSKNIVQPDDTLITESNISIGGETAVYIDEVLSSENNEEPEIFLQMFLLYKTTEPLVEIKTSAKFENIAEGEKEDYAERIESDKIEINEDDIIEIPSNKKGLKLLPLGFQIPNVVYDHYKYGRIVRPNSDGVYTFEICCLSDNEKLIDPKDIFIFRINNNNIVIENEVPEGAERSGQSAKSILKKSAPLKGGTCYIVLIDGYSEDDSNATFEMRTSKIGNELIAVDNGMNSLFDGEGITFISAGYDSGLFPFEELLSFIVRTTANGLVWLIRWAVGGQGVTIDDIIFNKYEPTKLVFFDAEARAGNSIISAISGSINTWFSIFRNIAITGYIVILLYMGIQIMLKSTGDKQAEYKKLLVDWVMGVALLFLFPYIIKYCIELNNLLVGMIEVGKSDMNIYGEIIDTKVPYLNSESSKEEQQNFTDHFDSNPFEGEDSGASLSKTSGNYMAMMAKKADKTKRLSYAIVYMIMAWQLLMIVIAYYKRLFMVAFLLVIFPVVTLTYALDKVKDGK